MVEDKTKDGGMKNGFHIFRNHFAPLHLPHNGKWNILFSCLLTLHIVFCFPVVIQFLNISLLRMVIILSLGTWHCLKRT